MSHDERRPQAPHQPSDPSTVDPSAARPTPARPATDSFEAVFDQIPSGLFVLTTAFDGHRSGVLARWVQRCSIEPPMVMVAIPKGQSVEPLILDSRAFAICRIGADDRLLLRTFMDPTGCGHDPFIAISTRSAPSGSPIIDRAYSYMDCEVCRHVELESDHRVYVGQVNAAAVLRPMAPSGESAINGHGHTRPSWLGAAERREQAEN